MAPIFLSHWHKQTAGDSDNNMPGNVCTEYSCNYNSTKLEGSKVRFYTFPKEEASGKSEVIKLTLKMVTKNVLSKYLFL